MSCARAVTVQVRPGFTTDAGAIAHIHVAAWQSAYRDLLPPEVLVAEIDHAVVGWIAFGRCRDPGAQPHHGEVWAFYVAPSHWGQGVGQALWAQARERLEEEGYATISLWVLADNTRARRFYRQAGFVLHESRERVLSQSTPKTLMEARYLLQL